MKEVNPREDPSTPIGNNRRSAGASAPRFGTVSLSHAHQRFYNRLNHQTLDLCASFPRSMRTDGLLFFTQYAGLPIESGADFFHHFLVPSWSIVHHLCQEDTGTLKTETGLSEAAISAHAMAMCLHSLDDHLTDGQIAATPLTLLIRSQAWRKMHSALDLLTASVPGGHTLVAHHIDRYYAGLRSTDHPETLDAYCRRFRDQMATGVIVPLLLAQRLRADPDFSMAVEQAFGSFGIAWRLMDDICDLSADMAASVPSAVFVCLDDQRRRLWLDTSRNRQDRLHALADHIHHENVCGCLIDRICHELEQAAEVMASVGMPGMAEEYRSMLEPLT